MTIDFDKTIYDPLQDGISSIQLIDFMGGELAIVNDARASFNKESTELTSKDKKLIKYLIEHKHFSPLRSTVFKFKVKAPLFLCRQIWKHVIASSHIEEQISHNETSFRYTEVTDSNEFYIPAVFRLQSKDNKQATEGNLNASSNQMARTIYKEQCEDSFRAYQQLLQMGVGREQARGVLVPSVYTTWVWTVSLQALLNFIELREGAGAQSEIQLYAQTIKVIIADLVPTVLDVYEQNL
jgi:thymidylate synthase (FAD)